MPEGHTIHRLARDHQKWFAGSRPRSRSPQGRFDDGAAAIDRTELHAVEAHGKHLFYRFAAGRTVHVHLGLYGKHTTHRCGLTDAPDPRETCRWRLSGRGRTVDLVGPTACELLDETGVGKIRSRLGPDPARDDADPEPLFETLGRSRSPIGVALMDQSKFAGVGNIFRAEALWWARLHPRTPSRDVDRELLEAVWDRLREWFATAIRGRYIVTREREELDVPPSRLRRGERLNIYKQPGCRRCGAEPTSAKMAGRTVWWCPRCQGR